MRSEDTGLYQFQYHHNKKIYVNLNSFYTNLEYFDIDYGVKIPQCQINFNIIDPLQRNLINFVPAIYSDDSFIQAPIVRAKLWESISTSGLMGDSVIRKTR